MNSNFDRQVDFAAASEYFQPNSLYICILYDILSSFFEVGKIPIKWENVHFTVAFHCL